MSSPGSAAPLHSLQHEAGVRRHTEDHKQQHDWHYRGGLWETIGVLKKNAVDLWKAESKNNQNSWVVCFSKTNKLSLLAFMYLLNIVITCNLVTTLNFFPIFFPHKAAERRAVKECIFIFFPIFLSQLRTPIGQIFVFSTFEAFKKFSFDTHHFNKQNKWNNYTSTSPIWSSQIYRNRTRTDSQL